MRQIFCTYSVVTSESAEQGDSADHGWYDNGFKYTPENKPETGYSCELDQSDIDDGLEPYDLAIIYLREKGVRHPSSSYFHPGVWYSTESTIEDYSTDESIEYSFHLEGFSEAEQYQIFDQLFPKR